jgi:molecular chaperone GrpE
LSPHRKRGNGGAPEEAHAEEPSGLEPVAEPEGGLEALKAERDDLKEQLLRRRADFENYKKRVERDRQQTFQDARAEVMKALVPTLDNLDRAAHHADAKETLAEGLELIRRNLMTALEGLGLETEDPLGQPYDPEVHEALSHDEVPGTPENTIVEVFRKGYRFKDRLLRPALVRVAKSASKDGPGNAVD